MAAESLSAFKDLVESIEESKNLIEHELLSEEELNTLKQTSSLVAKFQREALTEKENRVSAELLAKEKERLVSDAWKIVSALKKDKYALELQLERLKSNKPVTRRLSNKRLSKEHKDKETIKSLLKADNITETDCKKHSKHESNDITELSSDGLKTSNSSDSKEKEDSVKEPKSDNTSGDQLQEMCSAATEDEEVEVEDISSDETIHARGNSYKRCSPNDMIKLWTAKPYVSRKRHEGGENKTNQETSWYERKDGLKKYSERARDFHARLQNYKTHSKNNDGKSKLENSKNLKKDTATSVSGEEISTSKDEGAHNIGNDGNQVTSSGCHGDVDVKSCYQYDSTAYHLKENNKASRSESIRKSLENKGTGSNQRGYEVYGRYASMKTSPLVSHSLSSSNEAKEKDVRRIRDYINLLNPQEKPLTDESNKVGIKSQEKIAVKKIPKTDSHTRLIISPKSLPGGVVSKRIQGLARRLKLGYSTAMGKKKTDGMPEPDDMDLRNPCPGLCGLENLGNSCFMNAGLQCLFVIKPFYRFFLEGVHQGLMKNKSKNQQSNSLSSLLGRLIEKVYSGCYLTCEPSALFACLQSKFPQLDAFRQHDCQEFLALFLDALHQELNTANKNTRRSIRQMDNKNIRSADQWWRMYNEEHESVIVDTFQGQFRNKVTCSECGHVSVTYQLFSFLSLPLVSQKMQSFVITFIPNNRPALTNTSKPKALRLRVQASKPSSTSQIKQRLISLLPEDERPNCNNLFLAVVRDSSIVGLLHDDRIVTPFNDKHTKLYAYEPLLPPLIDSTNIESPVNNATSLIQSHEPSRQHIKEKNTLLVPLGNIDDVTREGCGRRTRASLPIGYHLTFTCSICVQEKPSKELLQHDECGKVYCRDCLQVSAYEENVKCPDCSRPSSTGRSKKLNMKYINVPVMFRHQEPDSEVECTLFGHPNLVTLPYEITGEELYQHIAVLLPVASVNKKTRAVQTLPFTLHLVNYQGRYCSRCDRVYECTGCCLQADDVLSFQNGDHIAIQLTNIIQLEIDKMSRFCDHESMRIKHLTCRLQLQDCLRSFVDREELQDLWSCPECHQERSATKSMSVVRYPDTLIIHLKRYNQSNMKVFTPVEFPFEDLDMGEFMYSINSPRESFSTGDNVYDLMGCVCHDGDFECGHYTAYTRHGINAEWCLFDDFKVTKECPNSSSYKKVYLLFYNRRAGSPLCTSVDETLTPTKISSKTYDRRKSLEDKHKKKQTREMKSLSSINETNSSEVVVQTSHRPLEDAMDSNSTSTPKEMLKKQTSSSGKTKGVTRNTPKHVQQEKVNGVTINISREQEEPRSVIVTIDRQQKERQKEKRNTEHSQRKEYCVTDSKEVTDSVFTDIDGQEEPSAQCDCSQCDYFRELEQQIKRCRRSVSGTKSKETGGEFGSLSSRGLSPSTTTPTQTTRLRNTTRKGYETKTHELPERSPPLACSDSIDSELDNPGVQTTNQAVRIQYHRPTKYSPTSTSSDPMTDMEADAEGSSDNARRKSGLKEYYADFNTGEGAGKSRCHTKTRDGRAPQKKGDNDGNMRRRSSSGVHFRDYEKDHVDPCNLTKRRSSSWVDVTEEDIDNETVATKTTQMTDNAVQCTLLDEHGMEYGSDYEYCSLNRSRNDKNKVDSGVQVSISKPKHKQRKSPGNQKRSDDQNIDQEEVEFLTRKLIFAVENEDLRYALQLLKEGADPSLLIDGVSAIHLSAGMISSLGFHFTRLFLECGADSNIKSADGVTPVHVAAMWGQTECLKLLLRKGGNPYSEDAEGRNAVDLAKLFENDTSANTSKYLSRLDEHYTSLIHSETFSNASLTSQISTSELQYMPYLYETDEEEDCKPYKTRNQLAQLFTPKHEMNDEGGSVPLCGSWTHKLKKKVKKNKLVRTVSGNLRRTSSRLAGRFRNIGGRLSSSSDRHRQTHMGDTDSDI